MAISRRLRYEILRRDNHQCRYCGDAAPDVPLTVDHVTPVALGGSDDPTNLVTACKDCNAGKSSASPDQALLDDVRTDSELWEQAKSAAAEGRKATMYVGFEDEISAFDAAWVKWRVGEEWDSDLPLIPRPDDWRASMRVWLLRELPIQTLIDLIPVAMNKTAVPASDRWRYFCGCAWRAVDKFEADTKAAYEELQRKQADDEIRKSAEEFWGPLITALVNALPDASIEDLADICEAASGVVVLFLQRRPTGTLNDAGVALWHQDETVEIDELAIRDQLAASVPAVDPRLEPEQFARSLGVHAWRVLHEREQATCG